MSDNKVDHHFVNDFGEVQTERIVNFDQYTKLLLEEVLVVADDELSSLDFWRFSDKIKRHFEK